MRLCTQLLPILLAAVAFAAKPLGDAVCVGSCYDTLLAAKYTGANDKAQLACTNPLRVQSTYYCILEHCAEEGEKALATGIAWWVGSCKNSSKIITVKNYHTAVSNITEKYLAGLPKVDQNAKTVFKGPTVPSPANWAFVYDTVFTYADNKRFNDSIRYCLYGFWGLVLLLGTLNRLWSLATRHQKSSAEKQTGQLSVARKAAKWLNINLFEAPTGKRNHHEPWGGITLPLRIQTIIILLYVVLHIAVISVRYRIYDESFYYKTRKAQLYRYMGDRIASMLSASIPFIFLFGARSSPLPILTGWSYRTLSLFHRWVATVLLLEGLIHGCVMSAFEVNDKTGWDNYRTHLRTDDVFRSGIIMVTSLAIAASFAIPLVRRVAYEAFKIVHIAMTILFLGNYMNHVEAQFGGQYEVWLWVSVGIWASDYFFRIVRIVWLNINSFFGKDNRAIASYSEETGMIRLQVHSSSRLAKQTPGKYYFLHFGGWRIWENHPFSLAGISAGENTAAATVVDSSDSEKRSPITTSQPEGTELVNGQSYRTFMIRPQTGFTRRLRDSIIKQDSAGVSRLRVVLEGPYGSVANFAGFNEILFVAGGSGITAVIPYIRHIFEDVDQDSPCPNVRLVWVMREVEFARDVLANDLRLVEASQNAATKLRINIFVSSGAGEDSSMEKSDSENTASSQPDSRFSYSKPVMGEVIREYVEATKSNTPAVFVCGPARMADEVRAAVRKESRSSVNDVKLFEEVYCW